MSKRIDNVVDGETKSSAWGKTNQSFRDISLDTDGFASLKAKLDRGNSGDIQIISDSTGDSGAYAFNMWPELLASHLATAYPNHLVDYAYKGDLDSGDYVKTNYNNPGADIKYGDFTTAGYLARYKAITPTSDDFQIEARVSLDDLLTTTARNVICCQWDNASSDGRFWLGKRNSTGTLRFYVSTDGSSESLAAIWDPAGTYTNGEDFWIKVTFDKDNGSSQSEGKMYHKKNEGDAWTLVNTTPMGSVLTLHTSSTPISVGAYYAQSGGVNYLNGKVWDIRLRDGIDGADLVPRRLDKWWFQPGIQIMGGTYPIITIWNAAESGVKTEDAITSAKQSMQIDPDVYIVNLGHNDDGKVAFEWADTLRQLTDQFGIYSNAYVTAQNPTSTTIATSPQTPERQETREIRNSELPRFVKQNNLSLIDVYKEFEDDGRPLDDLMADGSHPNEDGQAVWGSLINEMFDRSY